MGVLIAPGDLPVNLDAHGHRTATRPGVLELRAQWAANLFAKSRRRLHLHSACLEVKLAAHHLDERTQRLVSQLAVLLRRRLRNAKASSLHGADLAIVKRLLRALRFAGTGASATR